MGKSEQELLQDVLDARKVVDDLDASLKSAKEVKTNTEAKLIEHMDDTGKTSFKSAMFPCTVSKSETLYVSIIPEVHDEGLRFIEEECGRGDIIKRSVHNKTLSSFIGQRLKAGEAVPQDLFKYHFQPTLSIRMN